jgi:hypothetical protein
MPDPDKVILDVSPTYKKLKSPSTEFFISYNSATESLEPIYFWLLDFMGGPGSVDKLIDNFQSTPGSGHFSELMGKATRMQEEGMKVMQTIGVLIKSVINIIYDLRQFETRLNDYDAANGKKGKEKISAGIMALKQTWLDNVDIKRGNSSIKAMTFSQQGAFVTLLNAFMAADSISDVKKLDLNETVKRILESRILEFDEWKKLSEDELRKRYNIERYYLKSQVDSLKLYSRWATPYFRAAEELRQGTDTTAALVKAFNSILMRLVLFQKKEVKVEDAVLAKDLPKGFDKLKPGKDYRKFYACVMLDFTFRGIPQKVDQHYGFGGKSDVTFRAFALNQDELDLFKKKLDDSDINEALKFVEGATKSSLEEIQKDIEYFLKDLGERPKEKKEEKKENINPFSALLGFGNLLNFKKEEKTKEQIAKEEKERIAKLEKDGIKPDNYYERQMRSLTELNAKKSCFGIYDVYKKAHGMASVPFADAWQKKEIRVGFTDLFKK